LTPTVAIWVDLTPSGRMLYSCTHVATVGVKGLNICKYSKIHTQKARKLSTR